MTVRQRAIIKILTGGFIFAMVLYSVMVYGLGEATGGGIALIATAIPCVPFLIGVVEFLFGVPINRHRINGMRFKAGKEGCWEL